MSWGQKVDYSEEISKDNLEHISAKVNDIFKKLKLSDTIFVNTSQSYGHTCLKRGSTTVIANRSYPDLSESILLLSILF